MSAHLLRALAPAAAAVLATAALAFPLTALAAAGPVPTDAAELTSMESGLEGQQVVIEGELVSEALTAGDGHVWLNVLSEGVAIGVYAPESTARGIEEFGDYDTTGEMVRVTGTFNAACDEHGGDLDIHATTIEQTAPAVVRTHEIGWWKLWLGIVALSCAVAAYVLPRRAERRAVS